MAVLPLPHVIIVLMQIKMMEAVLLSKAVMNGAKVINYQFKSWRSGFRS